MSISPVTLSLEPNPVFEVVEAQDNPVVQETVVQSNPIVGAVTVQPIESSATAIQAMQETNQILQQTQLQQQLLEGESISLIASETGQSVTEVENELGIPTAFDSPPAAILVTAPESAATTAPAATAAAAIATYVAVPEATALGSTAQSQSATLGSTLSVEV